MGQGRKGGGWASQAGQGHLLRFGVAAPLALYLEMLMCVSPSVPHEIVSFNDNALKILLKIFILFLAVI